MNTTLRNHKITMNRLPPTYKVPRSLILQQLALVLPGLLTTFSCQDICRAEVSTVEGFTEPIESIDVAAMEAGPISSVLIRRGQRVRKGELLVTLNDEVLRESRAAVEAEATSVANIEALEIERVVRQRRYETLKRLEESGSGSQEEVKLAKADFDVASKKVEAAKEQLGIAKFRLRELDARIAQRRILSPIDGIVVDVKKKRGEYVAAEELHVATIVRLEQLRAVFFVPTKLAAEMTVQKQQMFRVRIPLIKKAVDASLEYVAPVTEPDSGLVRVHLLIPNPREAYRSGVRCILDAENTGKSATVEATANASQTHESKQWVATARSRTIVRRDGIHKEN